MTPASNTPDCFREFLGQRLTGLLFHISASTGQTSPGTTTLLFEDGRGLAIASSGAYWIESAADVAEAIRRRRVAIEEQQLDLQRQLAALPERATP